MLARAFRDDPAYGWIFPDPADRARRLPALFRLLYDSDARAGPAWIAGEGAAATLWRAPGRARVGPAEVLRHAFPLLAALGGNALRALRLARAIEAHMPNGSFWYLHCAGCEPMRQRAGLGSAAVRAGLTATAGHDVYLETARAENVTFYRTLGFAVTAGWDAPGAGPRFWSMLRPAQCAT